MAISKKIDCNRCSHYYVTWDQYFPMGCRGLGFKSKELPSEVVLKSSGMECQLFSQKKKTQLDEEGGGDDE